MDKRRPLSRDGFEIAIICALPLERDAVEALLDEDYEEDGHSYGKAVSDKNAYTIGRLGKQHVVVAHMPGTGTISAAAVAADLNSSFHKIKVAFVVGVCGGIPVTSSQGADEAKIFLGDVIVSTSVVQVDFGRQYPNGFRRKKEVEEILGRADPEIRAFVGKVSGHRSRERLKDKTCSLSTQMSLRKGFSSAAYPGPQHDILYAADHRHKHWNLGCKICDKCENNDDEVCEPALGSYCGSLGCQGVTAADMQEARKPAVHFGRMACGNQVIKSGLHRDRLAAQEKVIGFEMESAGTWDYVPTIVVKGVCDYADSHKSKRWQQYAAATAAACTKAILEEWRSADRRDQSLGSKPAFPVHTTITRPVNTLFAGRHDVLCDLKSIIRKAVEDRSQREPCYIVISGMGGQGKSEICLQLAHQLGEIFWGIFWIDVSTTSLAENGFLNVAGRLGAAVSTWEAARQELANVKQPWLLVLDNADDPGIDYQSYFPVSTFGVVLLTSRNAECERYATKRWINLEGLAHVDAQELLFRAARISDARRESLGGDTQAVAQLLQSHPLALIQAGLYIGRGHCSLKDYPHVYKRQRKRLLAFRPAQARSRYRNVYAIFEASAETLQLSGTAAASDALHLLPLLAAYGPSRLPVLLFEAAWERARFVSTSEVASSDLENLTLWHATRLPTFLQVEAEAWDSFRLVEALNLLKAFSLISFDTTMSFLSVSMHPLVHAWAWDRLSTEQQHACWVQAGCVVALSRRRPDLWLSHARQLQPHLQAITSWSMSSMFSSDPIVEICRIIVNCGWLLEGMRDDTKLLTLMDLLRAHLNIDRLTLAPQWLDIYALTTRSLFNSGLTKDAVTLQEQVVKIREQTLAEDHSDRLASQHVLAGAYHANGQVKDAVSLLQQVVKIREQTLAEDHPDRLASQHELARAYHANGQVKDAVSLLQQVVKIKEQTLAEDHPDRLASQHELARAYHANGQVKDAVTLLEQVVKIREQTLAEDHPDRLASQHELARAYHANGQVKDAVTLLEQVVKIREQTLAEDHPNRLASRHELARAYHANGQVKDAVILLQQVVKIKEQTLAEDHPSRLVSQEVLAVYLWQVGDEGTAIDIMRQVVNLRRQSLDEDHPDRMRSQRSLHYFDTKIKVRQSQKDSEIREGESLSPSSNGEFEHRSDIQ